MLFHWYQAETGPPLLGHELLELVALFQINKSTAKEAATCVSVFIEFLVSESLCWLACPVFLHGIAGERAQHFKQEKVVSVCTKESRSISGIQK